MNPIKLDEGRLDEFERRLRSSPTLRVSTAQFWRAFSESFPHRPHFEERQWLLRALEELAQRGAIALPSERGPHWDRALHPHLPEQVRIVKSEAPRAKSWKTFPWNPRLAWIADIRYVSEEQEAFLRRVQEGIANNWFGRLAPLKYRSLQLTGDEKALSTLIDQQLFGPGRLDTTLLGIVPETTPLAWARVAGSGPAIIFENAASFTTALAVLHEMQNPPYSIVCFGDGDRITSSISSLASVPGAPSEVHYVGDLDWHGLEIALRTQARAESEHGWRLVAAPGLHRAMLSSASRLGSSAGWPTTTQTRPRPECLSFLPANVRADVDRILGAGNRVPEEVLAAEDYTQAWTAGR